MKQKHNSHICWALERQLSTESTTMHLQVIIRKLLVLTKVYFVHVYPQIPLLWSNIRLLILNTI